MSLLGTGKSFVGKEGHLAAQANMQNAVIDLGNRIREREYREEIEAAEAAARVESGVDNTRWAVSRRDRIRAALQQSEDRAAGVLSAGATMAEEQKGGADAAGGGEGGEHDDGDGDDDEDDDSWMDDDEDAELERIRARRMRTLKKAAATKAEHKARGGGELSEVTQDEFLPKVTQAPHVVCLFYHNDFKRCLVMEKHLKLLAEAHPECTFLKINAEKAPFFVRKLGIRILPSTVLFRDGKTSGASMRILGFNGLLPEEAIKNATRETPLDFCTRDLEDFLLAHKFIKESIFPEDVRDVNARMAKAGGKAAALRGNEEYVSGNLTIHRYDEDEQ